jgi:hypothetical protein
MVKKMGILLIVILGAVIFLFVVFRFIVRPWYLSWGATEAEIAETLPGDELLPSAAIVQTNAITIQASPQKIYPWIIQLGQQKGGFYSYEKLENLAGCDIHNADRIHAEWQNTVPGDQVLMFPADKGGPPPYLVAAMQPDQVFILGHHPGAALTGRDWNDTWQFILKPVDAQTTRLVIRTRTNNVGGIWDIVEPISFVMQYGMMNGIKLRAENN